MQRKLVKLTTKDGIARITIDRPEVRNALNDVARGGLSACLDEVAGDGTARVLILTGAGSKAFVAGSDVSELLHLDAAQSEALSLRIMDFHERLQALRIPVIAAVNGWCLGSGLELALACDIRIASENARFGVPEITLAIAAGAGGGCTVRLSRLVGAGIARALCLTGEIIDAERAYQIGLVSKVVLGDDLLATTEALALRLAGFSPFALRETKQLLDIVEHADLATAQRAEVRACVTCFASNDQKEGMRAFLEKRPPRFTGT